MQDLDCQAKIEALERQLEQYQKKAKDTLRWAGLATWTYVVEQDAFEIDEEVFRSYDLEISHPLTLEKFKNALLPDDRELYTRLFEEFLVGKRSSFDLHHRLRTRSGEWVWFNSRGGSVERDVSGKPVRAIGIAQNIMKVKIAELEIQRRDRLLSASNEAARILLEDIGDNHDTQIWLVLELLGAATDVDRVYIWKNYTGADGRFYTTQIYEWSLGADPQQGNEWTVDRPVEEAIPTWEAIFRAGNCVNNLVRLMPQAEQDQLSPQGIISILVAPIMFKDEFWGFIGFDDCQKERVWSDSEAGILKSAGMIVAAAIMRQQAEKELIVARDLAEAGTRSKGEFLARMSHEIRTPMNAILGMCYLCLQTELNDAQRDYLQKTQTATLNLLGIIDDVLDFSKIEAGKMELENIPLRLSNVLKDVIDVVDVKVHDKGLQFVHHVDESVYDNLIGDPLRIRQVLTNIINNAVKFTEEGSISVTIHAVDAEEGNEDPARTWLEFAVRDSGIGMTPEQVELLFQSFSQADGSTTRKYGGTGLGLIISKRFVEMMGGRIWVESEAGIGSTFLFRIPFSKYVPLEADRIVEMSENRKANLKDSRVLVVDDDPGARQVLRELIREFVASVETANNGEAAIAALTRATQESNPFDIVLLDWKMPRMDGLEMLRRLRESDQIVPPKTVMISGYDRSECLRQSKGLGLDAFLVKPVTRRMLEDTLQAVLLQQKKRIDADAETKNKADLNGAEILLVEDNKINQMVASELLRGFGVKLTIANNGLEAIEAVEHKTFDLVLMDIQMPEMDGLTATRRIRELDLPGVDRLPILAMTANAFDSDFQECLDAGMDDHLAKPINVKKLHTTLENWIVR